MSWIDDLNSQQDIGNVYRFQPVAKQQVQQQKKKKGNLLTALLPTATSIGGGAAGAAIGTALLPGIGTLIGAGLGSALGGGGGKVAENAIEGNKLSSGVAGEAALSGVLGAGPLRLGKAAIDTARGVRVGTGLAEALAQGGKAGADMSLTRAVGNKLTGASDDLTVKNFRFTPSQLNNFKSKFGEDASQTLKRYGLTSGTASDISEKAIRPLQGEFDAIAGKIPDISKETLQKAFAGKYDPLLKSAVEDNKSVGQQLKSQAEGILKKYGDNVPGSEIGNLRKEFDSLVSYADKAANPARYGVNKRAADTLRGVLQGEADKAGLKSGNNLSFKEVGQELSKLRQLSDSATKQEQLGRGSLPLGLSSLMGAGTGGFAGGIPGIAAGAVMTKVANSQPARRLVAGATEKAGQKLIEKAAQKSPYGIKEVAKRVAPVGIAQALYQSSGMNIPTTPMNPNTAINPNSSNITDTSYQNTSSMSSGASITPENYQRAVIEDLQATGGKNLNTLKSLYDQFGPQQQKPLNSTAAGVVADTQTGLNALSSLSDAIAQSNANNPLLGGLRAANPFDTNAQNLQAQVATAKQIVGKALEGGVLRKEDEAKYAKLLPTMRDSDQVAQFKIQQLQGLIGSRLQQYLSALGSGGGETDQNTLAAALGM